MGWVIALLAILLIVAAIGVVGIYHQTRLQGLLLQQVALTRRELAAGLGVNIDDPNGYLDQGHLTEIVEDVRDRRKREAEVRRAEREHEWDRRPL